jgi:Domain of unknown function (DUF1851)
MMQRGAPNRLLISPDSEAIEELGRAWSWLLPEHYQPLLFSALGDMFFQVPSGEVHWLNTGTGEITKVAADQAEFRGHLDSELALDWFLPDLIDELAAKGQVLEPGQSYTFVRLPIFREGTYTADNLRRINAREHFGLTGRIHQQIHDLPDGTEVNIKLVD